MSAERPQLPAGPESDNLPVLHGGGVALLERPVENLPARTGVDVLPHEGTTEAFDQAAAEAYARGGETGYLEHVTGARTQVGHEGPYFSKSQEVEVVDGELVDEPAPALSGKKHDIHDADIIDDQPAIEGSKTPDAAAKELSAAPAKTGEQLALEGPVDNTALVDKVKDLNKKNRKKSNADADEAAPGYDALGVAAEEAHDEWIRRNALLTTKGHFGRDKANDKAKINAEYVDEAYQDYLEKQNEFIDAKLEVAKSNGLDEMDVDEIQKILIGEASATAIADLRNEKLRIAAENKGPVFTKRFADWWARVGGGNTRGNGKPLKALSIGALAAATGVAAGLSIKHGANYAAVPASVALAVYRVKDLKQRIFGRADQKGGNVTVADKQADAQSQRLVGLRNEAAGRNEYLTLLGETQSLNADAIASNKRNKNRVRGAAIIAGAAALGGVLLANHLNEIGDADHASNHPNGLFSDKAGADPADTTNGADNDKGAPVHTATPEIVNTDKVEKGDGVINTLQDLAHANGHDITTDQASTIYEHLRAQGVMTPADVQGTSEFLSREKGVLGFDTYSTAGHEVTTHLSDRAAAAFVAEVAKLKV